MVMLCHHHALYLLRTACWIARDVAAFFSSSERRFAIFKFCGLSFALMDARGCGLFWGSGLDAADACWLLLTWLSFESDPSGPWGPDSGSGPPYGPWSPYLLWKSGSKFDRSHKGSLNTHRTGWSCTRAFPSSRPFAYPTRNPLTKLLLTRDSAIPRHINPIRTMNINLILKVSIIIGRQSWYITGACPHRRFIRWNTWTDWDVDSEMWSLRWQEIQWLEMKVTVTKNFPARKIKWLIWIKESNFRSTLMFI